MAESVKLPIHVPAIIRYTITLCNERFVNPTLQELLTIILTIIEHLAVPTRTIFFTIEAVRPPTAKHNQCRSELSDKPCITQR